jgi:site-specific recombinase XerD
LSGFAAELMSCRYALLTTRDYVRSAAHLGRWMDTRRIAVGQITDATISAFADHRCRCRGAAYHHRRRSHRYIGRVRRFVEHLRDHQIVPTVVPAASTAPTALDGFGAWMIRHRGVKPKTVARYERLLWRLLPALGDDPTAYDAANVRRALLTAVQPVSRAYAKDYVTALRSYLRFLAVEQRCRPSLDRAVPTVPHWKLSALPRYLEAADVERTIAACDHGTAHGRRDRAILLLLARLGLRAGDIVAMRLHDLDWEVGSLRVSGKGRKEVLLPLPTDAGRAVLEYLVHGRPTTDLEQVFLCVNAPLRPFATSASVSDIVRFALKRAGITNPPSRGAHLLRHSAATMMLRAGASLDAIATVLRHQSRETTVQYAKVDIDLLQRVAQPWPEEAPC